MLFYLEVICSASHCEQCLVSMVTDGDDALGLLDGYTIIGDAVGCCGGQDDISLRIGGCL